jgi:serine-type D-Ala-D-Ala carboxypeptidase/endopeptidase (penicillin-binding protein 4)
MQNEKGKKGFKIIKASFLKGHSLNFYILNFSFLLVLSSCTTSRNLQTTKVQSLINDPALINAHVGISIFDPETNQYIYNHQGNKYFVPASNIKIPTLYAAMKHLGDSIVGFRYAVTGSKVSILPTGDPTFLHPDFQQQPAYNFLRSFDTVQILNPLFDDSFLGSGWSWNDYKSYYMAQKNNFPVYGNVVKFNWENSSSVNITPSYFKNESEVVEMLSTGFQIEKPWDENTFVLLNGRTKNVEVPFRPDPGTILNLISDTLKKIVDYEYRKPTIEFKTLYSQSTDSLMKLMMFRSDNFYAEQALLMVGNELLGTMNTLKVTDTILKLAFSDLPQKPRWVDGSGLSRYNLFSPNDFIVILNKMKNEFGMERLKSIFATGGQGTISNFYKSDSTFIYAKTGTLSGVVALSGYLYTTKNKLLLFSILVNNHNGSATDVRRAVERFIQQVRRNQ